MAYVALCHDMGALLDAFRGPQIYRFSLGALPWDRPGPSCGQIAKLRESDQSDYVCYTMKIQTHKTHVLCAFRLRYVCR